MYSDLIIDLYKHPLNKHSLERPTMTNSGANLTCGDSVRIYAVINKDGTIQDISFEGEGCAISMATASLLTENAKGKIRHEVLEWNTGKLFEFLEAEIGATRIKCALLPLEVLQSGLKKYKKTE